jgi:hypothetical protein
MLLPETQRVGPVALGEAVMLEAIRGAAAVMAGASLNALRVWR